VRADVEAPTLLGIFFKSMIRSFSRGPRAAERGKEGETTTGAEASLIRVPGCGPCLSAGLPFSSPSPFSLS
jgi:hypothetical protein